MAVVDFPVMPDATWEISAVGIRPVAVVAPNWLVALGLAIHRMGEDALPGSMACEVLRSGSAVAHDFEHQRRYVVRRAGEQSFAESRTDPGFSVIDTPQHRSPRSSGSEPVYSSADAPEMTTEATAFEQAVPVEQAAPFEQAVNTQPTAMEPTAPMPQAVSAKERPLPAVVRFEEGPDETELFLPELRPTPSEDTADIEPMDDLFTFTEDDAPVTLELAETESLDAGLDPDEDYPPGLEPEYPPGLEPEYPPGLEPEYPPGLEPENDIVVPQVAPIMRPPVASRPLDPLFKKPLGAVEPEAPRSLFKKPFGVKKAS